MADAWERIGQLTFPDMAQQHSPTSIAAAAAIRPARPNLREKVYAAIAEHGPLTDEQLADLLEMNPSTVRPRRIELQRAGRIHEAGKTKTKSGRKAVTWNV